MQGSHCQSWSDTRIDVLIHFHFLFQNSLLNSSANIRNNLNNNQIFFQNDFNNASIARLWCRMVERNKRVYDMWIGNRASKSISAL